MDSSASAASLEEAGSHQVFLKRLQTNFESEISAKVPAEDNVKKLKLLEKKLQLLDVPDSEIRNIFIKNGNTEKSLLEDEYKELSRVYKIKIGEVKDSAKWKKTEEHNIFIIEEIKKIKFKLNKEFLFKQLSQVKFEQLQVEKSLGWLKDERDKRDFNGINAKIHNTEYLSRDHDAPHEMAFLRGEFEEKYKKITKEAKDDEVKMKKLLKDLDLESPEGLSLSRYKSSERGQKFIKNFVAKRLYYLEQRKIEVTHNLSQIFSNLKQFHPSLSYPIVWATVGKEDVAGGKKVDSFKYGSKKLEKEVYKPYTEIHKALMDANWALRDGKGWQQNYITAHILFVVSDRPHNKTKDQAYEGGRTYLDFPINLEWAAGWDEKYLEDHGEDSLARGVSKMASMGKHSEEALESFLTNRSKVKAIVEILKNKLAEKFGENEGFKVYEVNLFLNSNKNICNMGGEGCEQILNQLQSSRTDSSFLSILKSELESHGLKALTKSNDQFPRMLISVSSYEYFSAYCTDRLKGDALNALNKQKYAEDLSDVAVDTKKLSGKVIISSDELSIDPDFEYKKKFGAEESYLDARSSRATGITLQEDGVPFYSGFASAKGSADLIGDKRSKYQLPRSFDGVQNFPSSAVKATGQEVVAKAHDKFSKK